MFSEFVCEVILKWVIFFSLLYAVKCTLNYRALGRKGNALGKKGDYANAINFYNKSLAEHRTPDILGKLQEVRH